MGERWKAHADSAMRTASWAWFASANALCLGLGLAAGFGLFATTAFAVLRAVVRAAAGLLH